MKKTLLAAPVAGLAAYVVVAACSADAPLHDYCTNIPDGGCPGSDLSNCEDKSCAAIYLAQPNCEWPLVGLCPGYVAPHDAGHEGGDAADGALPDGHRRDVAFVLPPGANGGPGCEDLENPDCPVELASICDDCCGCQDLYVCSDGGWNSWGECIDGGIVAFPDGSN
jgi:hypothetical protein